MSILDKIKALLEEEEKEIEETSPAWVESGEVEIPSEIVAQLKRLNNLKGAIIGRLARESVDWELKKASLVNNVRQIEKSILHIVDDITVSEFEIIGDDNTTAGISVNPGSSSININDNTIHGMGLANSSNESPLSYGIIVWGNETPPNPPTNVTIDGNHIIDHDF